MGYNPKKQQYLDNEGKLVFRMFSGKTTITVDAMGSDGKFHRVFVPHSVALGKLSCRVQLLLVKE